MRRVVTRFNFSCNLIMNRTELSNVSYRQTLCAHTMDNEVKKCTLNKIIEINSN
jgi:hypothetical protein